MNIFGIQGGKGSFNEQALAMYVQKHQVKYFEVKYLFTSENVLRNLQEKKVDFGLFALRNTLGGEVEETRVAMQKYPDFQVVEEFPMQIRHFLMRRLDIETRDIMTIITHPQVLKQCAGTLMKKYPHLLKISGEGDLVDQAKAAEAISRGQLPKNYAVMGPEVLAKIYGFDIIDSDLQDNPDNTTFFQIVKQRIL